MADNIDIVVRDKIDSSISAKLKQIGTDALFAEQSVAKLISQLSKVTGSKFNALATSANTATTAITSLTRAQNSNTTAATRNANAVQNTGLQLSSLSKIAALAATALGVGQVLNMADAYTTMQNKLQNVATSQQQVNELTNRLFEISNRTRTGVEATTTAFTRFDRSLKSMGKSQEESLRLTETVNKALIISGATTSESASSLIQLSQAFNAGKLQGDEFRSIAENMPILLDAIAKSTGQPINKIKEMSTQGKITAEVLFNAFKSIETQMDSTFAKNIPTVSQAMVVLTNNATKFFGELDKKLGITQAMSSAILILSNNLDALALAAMVVSAALLVAFGPAIIGAIGAATLAVKAFTLALLANPLGLLLVALTAVVGYFVIFGDTINAGAGKLTTFADLASSSFNAIKFVLMDVIDVIGNLFSAIGGFFSQIATVAAQGYKNLTKSTADTVSKTSSFWDEYFTSQYTGWANVLIIVSRVMDTIVGIVLVAARSIANVFSYLFERAAAVGQGIKVALTEGADAGFKAMNDRLKNASFKEFGDTYKKAILDVNKTLETKGYENISKGIIASAQSSAAARNKKLNETSTLRGTGKNMQAGATDVKAAKAAESRAQSMAMVNMKLDDEINRLNMLAPLREQQAKFDQIAEQLAQKKITLTNTEAESIKAKIKAIQEGTKVQAEMDRIYQESVAASESYNNSLKAADMLLAKGAISREQYNRQILKSSEAYKDSLDPMRQEMLALQQQSALLGFLPKQRQIEAQVMELVNSKRKEGITLTNEQIKAYRDEITVLQQKNAVDSEKNSLLESSVYAREKYINQLQAIKELQATQGSGFTSGDAAQATSSALGGMGIDTSTMQVEMDAKMAMYQTYYEQLDARRAADLISEQDYANAKAQIAAKEFRTKYAAADMFFAGMAELQSSSIQEMAQLGKAAAITQAIINTYEGATKALAQGGIYGGVMAAIVVAQGLSQVAAIRAQGFKSGGYTGNMGTNQEAGVVHGQEFVMNAPTTARIGKSDLQALQNGSARVQRNNSSAGSTSGAAVAQQVSANNNSSSQSSSSGSNIRIINQLDPAMVGDYLATPDGEQVLVNVIRRNGDAIKSAVNS